MAEIAVERKAQFGRKQVAVGIVLIALATLTLLLLPARSEELTSTFVLTSRRGGVTIEAPDLVLSTWPTLLAIGLVLALSGIWQLIKGFERSDLIVALGVGLMIMGFLVWSARGASANLTGIFVSSLVRATPIALAALSGIYSERSGVVNIGIEGMILVGAFTSVVVASVSGSMLLGVLAGMLAGVFLALIHAVMSIRYMVNQIVSGASLIILALGTTSYLQRAVLNINPELNQPGPAIAAVPIPVLWKIPVLGSG